RIIDDGEGIEIAMVGRRRHGDVAKEIRDTLGQGATESPSATATSPATDFELIRVVDDGLNPQHAAVLVIHSDPVALHRVLDPGARPAALPVVQDLAGELPVELAPQESEDVLGAQAERGAAPGAVRSRRRVALRASSK